MSSAKKKNSKLIQLIVILGIVAVVMLPDEEVRQTKEKTTIAEPKKEKKVQGKEKVNIQKTKKIEKAQKEDINNVAPLVLGEKEERELDEALSKAQQKIENSKTLQKRVEELEQKIVIEKKKEVVPYPDYEVEGRGLVYNCEQKFWACVNRENYLNCNKTSIRDRSENIKIKCVTKEVYRSLYDCQIVQLKYIDQLLKVSKCN